MKETGFSPTLKTVQENEEESVQWSVVEKSVSMAEQVFSHKHGLSEEDIVRNLIGDYQFFGVGQGRFTATAGLAKSGSLQEFRMFKDWLAVVKGHGAIEKAKLEQAKLPNYTSELNQRIQAFNLALQQQTRTASTGAFWCAIIKSLDRRPFFLTEGYISLSPQETSAGDVACTFLGSGLPFVLRSVGGGTWRLLGEAYVHKAMDGDPMGRDQKMEMFDIC